MTASRHKWRCGLEVVLLVSTLLACGYSLLAHATPSRPVNVFDRSDVIDSVDVGNPSAAHRWTEDVSVNSPDSSDDDDDDDDGDGDGALAAEAPVHHDAAMFHSTSPHFFVAFDLSSTFTADSHSLRAPPL